MKYSLKQYEDGIAHTKDLHDKNGGEYPYAWMLIEDLYTTLVDAVEALEDIGASDIYSDEFTDLQRIARRALEKIR